MKIYCMSDIHGCLAEFEEALELILDHLEEEDTMLLLLGDYIHGGDSYGVLDKIMDLQSRYGEEKVLALMGNHEHWVLTGQSSIEHTIRRASDDDYDDNDTRDDRYIEWISDLPLYYVEGNTIFVHAGIDEHSGEMWEYSSDQSDYLDKYPPTFGQIKDLDKKVVAGHVYTSEISMNPRFHDIFYDGRSHYFIDGATQDSGILPILLVDTKLDKYYQMMCTGPREILPYSFD